MIREKKRYLLVGIEGARLSSSEAKSAAFEAIFSLFGDAGASRAKLQLKEFDDSRQLMILKCALAEMNGTIAALALKTEFRGKPIALRLKKITGIISHFL